MVLFFCTKHVAMLVAYYACGKQSLTVAPCSGNWAQRSPGLAHTTSRAGMWHAGTTPLQAGDWRTGRGRPHAWHARSTPFTFHRYCFWVLGHGTGSGKQDRASMLKCKAVPELDMQLAGGNCRPGVGANCTAGAAPHPLPPASLTSVESLGQALNAGPCLRLDCMTVPETD